MHPGARGRAGFAGVRAGAGSGTPLTFRSRWDRGGTGYGFAAIGDLGQWDPSGSDPSTVTAAVSSAGLGFSRTPVVFRLESQGLGPATQLRRFAAVPASTSFYARLWWRCDWATPGQTSNHIWTMLPIGNVQIALLAQRTIEVGGQLRMHPYLRTYYDAAGDLSSYPYNVWQPGTIGSGIAYLSLATWYRLEYFVQFLTATTYRIWPRIYSYSDAAPNALGTLLFDHTTIMQNDYAGTGRSLADHYALGHSFGIEAANVSGARDMGLGHEGSVAAAGEYTYAADLALSLTDWVGVT